MAYLLTIIGQYSPINKNTCKFCCVWYLVFYRAIENTPYVSAFSVYEPWPDGNLSQSAH